MATELAHKRAQQQFASKHMKQEWFFYYVKTNQASGGDSLADSDKSKATGGALTVKTDTAALISTKDNEM